MSQSNLMQFLSKGMAIGDQVLVWFDTLITPWVHKITGKADKEKLSEAQAAFQPVFDEVALRIRALLSKMPVSNAQEYIDLFEPREGKLSKGAHFMALGFSGFMCFFSLSGLWNLLTMTVFSLLNYAMTVTLLETAMVAINAYFQQKLVGLEGVAKDAIVLQPSTSESKASEDTRPAVNLQQTFSNVFARLWDSKAVVAANDGFDGSLKAAASPPKSPGFKD